MAQSVITTLLDVIQGLCEGVAETFVSAFNTLFVTETGALTNLGIWGIVFMGVGFVSTIIWSIAHKI